jgi:hypothetical protein
MSLAQNGLRFIGHLRYAIHAVYHRSEKVYGEFCVL